MNLVCFSLHGETPLIMEVLIMLRQGFEITLLAYFNIQVGQE